MKKIIIKSIHMENFKKFKDKTIEFGSTVTSIFGQNYKGKSSIADAFSWTMFNKSSTGNTEGSQFKPRRYDENGLNIDHVDVIVEMVLDIDGEELKIKKTQSQKWVRHHGDDIDSYMGDETKYEWNDVPVSATDHKKRVEAIISEEIFHMITNPAAFPTMVAKKQREFLTNNIANITNEDVFASNPQFAPIIKAAEGRNLDELMAKNSKEITAYKKKIEEIPIRIDQESKRVEEVDFSIKEALLKKLMGELEEIESKIENVSKGYEEINELKVEKERIKSELYRVEGEIFRDNERKKRELKDLVDKAGDEFNSCVSRHSSIENAVQVHKTSIETKEKELADLRNEYTSEMSKELEEGAYNCPTCGQMMPEEQREQIKADFDKNKANRISAINKKGQSISSEIARLKEELTAYESEIESLKQKKIEIMGRKNNYQSELDGFKPSESDSNSEWQELQNKLIEVEGKIAAINTADTDSLKEKLKSERSETQKAIDEVKESLALKGVIEKSKATIEELKEELIKVTQSLANCEQLESLIEKFNRSKMDMLSERINDKFKLIKWKLFEKQKNGKYAEVCVCMINGSQYGDNTTSATEKMMAGMDIIRTLQTIYNIEAPIFLDDADLYNDWNIPEMDCQLIKLCVSDDEELRVERKEV